MLYKSTVDSVGFIQNCQRKWLNVKKIYIRNLKGANSLIKLKTKIN